MRKYVVIYRAVFIENLQYTANIAMGFITYLILSVVFLNLWGYMYDAPGELIAGYTKEQMIWYVMITEMIWFGARVRTRKIYGGVEYPVVYVRGTYRSGWLHDGGSASKLSLEYACGGSALHCAGHDNSCSV